jgi:hypothetical protein
MALLESMFGNQNPQQSAAATAQKGPPPPAANIPANERVSKGVNAAQTAQQAAGAAQALSGGGAVAGAAGGAMAAAAAAIPIAGAVVAAVEMIKQEIDEIGEKNRQIVRATMDFGKNVLAMDADAGFKSLTQGFDSIADKATELAPALGMVTPAAKQFLHDIDEMRHSVKQAADKMALFNAGLAGQRAEHEVVQLLRDIGRAEKFGDQMRTTNEARFRAEQRMQDLTDKFVPLFLKFAEGSFTALNLIVTVLEPIADVINAVVEAEQDRADFLRQALDGIPGVGNVLRQIRDNLQEQKDNTNLAAANAMLEKFIGAQRDFGVGPDGFSVWPVQQMPAAPLPAMAPPAMP